MRVLWIKRSTLSGAVSCIDSMHLWLPNPSLSDSCQERLAQLYMFSRQYFRPTCVVTVQKERKLHPAVSLQTRQYVIQDCPRTCTISLKLQPNSRDYSARGWCLNNKTNQILLREISWYFMYSAIQSFSAWLVIMALRVKVPLLLGIWTCPGGNISRHVSVSSTDEALAISKQLTWIFNERLKGFFLHWYYAIIYDTWLDLEIISDTYSNTSALFLFLFLFIRTNLVQGCRNRFCLTRLSPKNGRLGFQQVLKW